MKNTIKKVLSQFLVFCIRSLNKIDITLTRHDFNPNPNHFEDHAPRILKDLTDPYYESIQWALKNENVKNLALTGPYGSGKSSVIRTFQHNHKEYKYLNISLASFKDENLKSKNPITDISSTKNINNKPIQTEIDDKKLIEISILQQIFYREKSYKFRYSRFKRINRIKWTTLALQSFLLILWLSSALLTFESISLINFLPEVKNENIKGLIPAVPLLIFVIGLFFLLISFLRFIKRANFNKLNLAKGEFELKPDGDTSVLNKYLDEIVYFFETTNYDVIVIEDLDRLNDHEEIFTKLREINTLINQSKQINRKVSFVYALKDEVFSDRDRTKFFDFIIPVIPVINSTNSKEILTKKLRTHKDLVIDKNLINYMSFYINDMRILNNIYNEFSIYKKKLEKLDLNFNKLLGIIIYKNLFPDDFSNLHMNEGIIYDAFNKDKSNVRDHLITSYDKKINTLEEEIEGLDSIYLNNKTELRSIYLLKIQQLIPDLKQIYLSSGLFNPSDLLDDELFDDLKKQNLISYQRFNGSQKNSRISFKSIEEQVNKDKDYNTRLKEIEKKHNEGSDKIKLQVQKLKEVKNEIKSWPLKKILNETKDLSFLDLKPIKNRALIHLLKNGFIDENFDSYISYFYEGSLTLNDKNFYMSVQDSVTLDFSYPLKNIDEIVNNLNTADFKKEEILNIDLANYLLENQTKYENEIDTLFLLLSSETSRVLAFIDALIDSGESTSKFIFSLCNNWKNIWCFIVNESNFPEEKKENYLRLIIKHSNIQEIDRLNINHSLSNYISKKTDFLSFISGKEYISNLKKTISNLSIKFEKLIPPFVSEDLFDFVYENNHYKLNFEMIKLIIEKKSKEEFNQEDFIRANYSTIQNSKCDHLIKYVEEKLSDYLFLTFFELEKNTREEEKYIIDLINSDISEEEKVLLLENQENLINEINDINDNQFWHLLFSTNKIKSTWKNIINYYDSNGFDESLVSYLNESNNYTELSKYKVYNNTENEEDYKDTFINQLISKDDISYNSFENLIKSINKIFSGNALNIDEVEEEKLLLLIENNLFKYSLEFLEQLKVTSTKSFVLLIEEYIKQFIEDYKNIEIQLTEDELYGILTSNKIKDNYKFDLFNNTNDSLFTESKKNSAEVLKLLIRKSFKNLPFESLSKLISNSKSIEDRVKILNLHLEALEYSQISEILNLIGNRYERIAIPRKRTKLPNSQFNLELVKNLNECDYISSFRESKNELIIISSYSIH